jgi:hypothetical protein
MGDARLTVRRWSPACWGPLGGDDSNSEADPTPTDETDGSSTDSATTELIGSWQRAQSCAEMLAAFQQARLAESHIEWLQGNFFGGEPGPTEGDLCEGALGPLEHGVSAWIGVASLNFAGPIAVVVQAAVLAVRLTRVV